MPLRPIAIGVVLVCLAIVVLLLIGAVRGIRARKWLALLFVVPALLVGYLASLPVPYLLGLNAPHPVFDAPAQVSSSDVIYYATGNTSGVGEPSVPGYAVNWQAFTLFAVQASTGKTLWQRGLPCGCSTLVRDSSAIYVLQFGPPANARSTQIVALEGGTGTVLWQRDLTGTAYGMAEASGTLLLDTGDGIFAVRSTDGLQLWSISAPQTPQAMSHTSLLAANATSDTFFDRLNGALEARHVADGTLRWSMQDPAPSVATQLAAGQAALYEIPSSGGTTAYDASNGHVLWRNTSASYYHFALTPGTLYLSGQIVNSTVAPGSTGHVMPLTIALDADTGAVRWTDLIYGQIDASAEGVFVQTHKIDALRASDGALLWHSPVSENWALSPRPTVDGSVAYFAAIAQIPPETLTITPAPGQVYLYAVNATTGALYWSQPVGPLQHLIWHITY